MAAGEVAPSGTTCGSVSGLVVNTCKIAVVLMDGIVLKYEKLLK
jgi:hypothetical protein